MERSYLTSKEIEALELYKKFGSQKAVAQKMESSGANISLTLKRTREKIVRSKNTLQQAEDKGYLGILGISYLTDKGILLDALLNSSDKAVCILDRNHKILMINEAIERLFGDGISDVAGKNCHKVFMSKGCSISDCPMSASFKTGKIINAIRKCNLNDGSERTFKITAIPVKNKRGRVTYGIEYFENVEE